MRPELSAEDRRALAIGARYVGSSEHKDRRWWGGLPRARQLLGGRGGLSPRQSTMRFQTDWIGGGSNACPEERATLCDLRIFVAEHNVCEFFDLVSNERFESLTVPSVNVAEGLATDWWRIFGGRDVTHKLLRYRTGFALPDLRLQFDGSTFDVSVRRLHSSNPDLIMDAAGGESTYTSSAQAARRNSGSTRQSNPQCRKASAPTSRERSSESSSDERRR